MSNVRTLKYFGMVQEKNTFVILFYLIELRQNSLFLNCLVLA